MPLVREIEGIGAQDQIAVVFEDGDVVDVRGGTRRRRGSRAAGSGVERPRLCGQGREVQEIANVASVRAKAAYFGSRGRAARCTEGLSDASAATHGFADCARIDRIGAQAAAVTASEMMAMWRRLMAGRPSYRQRPGPGQG